MVDMLMLEVLLSSPLPLVALLSVYRLLDRRSWTNHCSASVSTNQSPPCPAPGLLWLWSSWSSWPGRTSPPWGQSLAAATKSRGHNHQLDNVKCEHSSIFPQFRDCTETVDFIQPMMVYIAACPPAPATSRWGWRRPSAWSPRPLPRPCRPRPAWPASASRWWGAGGRSGWSAGSSSAEEG